MAGFALPGTKLVYSLYKSAANDVTPGRTKQIYAYGSIRFTFGESAGLTCTILPKCRIRFGFFVPSK